MSYIDIEHTVRRVMKEAGMPLSEEDYAQEEMRGVAIPKFCAL